MALSLLARNGGSLSSLPILTAEPLLPSSVPHTAQNPLLQGSQALSLAIPGSPSLHQEQLWGRVPGDWRTPDQITYKE